MVWSTNRPDKDRDSVVGSNRDFDFWAIDGGGAVKGIIIWEMRLN